MYEKETPLISLPQSFSHSSPIFQNVTHVFFPPFAPSCLPNGAPPSADTRPPPSLTIIYPSSSALPLPLLSLSLCPSLRCYPFLSICVFFHLYSLIFCPIFSPTCGFALHPSLLFSHPSLTYGFSLWICVCVWCYPEFTGAPYSYVCVCVCVALQK